MSGPPPGVNGPPPGVSTGAGGPPTPAQIAAMQEAGVKAQMLADPGLAFGSYIMGFFIDMILLGVLVHQVVYWLLWTNKEKKFIRVIVAVVGTLSVATSIFTIFWLFHLFVWQYGSFATFVETKYFTWYPLIDQAILVSCQIFYLERAYRLHHNARRVPAIIVPLMLVSAGAVIGPKIKSASLASYQAAHLIQPFLYTYFTFNLAVDSLLTGLIAWGLSKSKTGWSDTDQMIMRVIKFSCETQALPTCVAIAMVVQYSIDTQSFVGFFFLICHSKIAAVVLMAVLNFRINLRRDHTKVLQTGMMTGAGLGTSRDVTGKTGGLNLGTDHIGETHEMPYYNSPTSPYDRERKISQVIRDDDSGVDIRVMDSHV